MRTIIFAAVVLPFFFVHGEEPPVAKAPDAETLVKQGRFLFGQNKYVEALKAFEGALDKTPTNKETRFLAAMAAFWARKPERALDYWNRLYDAAARGGDDEWEIEKNRVVTLAALGQFEASELAVERLREIRAGGKSPAAKTASGFVREHFFGKRMRAGCWEALDERGDAPAIWTLIVKRETDEAAGNSAKDKTPKAPEPFEKTIATLAVETAPLPGGGTGFVFSEETEDTRRIYKRWAERPAYKEVRVLILAALAGTAEPLEEKPLMPAPTALLPDEDDEAVPLEIKAMALDSQTETIVFTAWKLKRVQADVTRLARIAPGDEASLAEYMREFNDKYPRAATTASELAELIWSAKPECVRTACDKLVKLSARSAYLEFALLTALNTRNRDIPEIPMLILSKSKDFLVRETTGLILARHGRKDGLEILFTELETADARGCELVMGALEELIGHVLDAPPNSKSADVETKLKEWKAAAAEWRTANLNKLEFIRESKLGEASWIKK